MSVSSYPIRSITAAVLVFAVAVGGSVRATPLDDPLAVVTSIYKQEIGSGGIDWAEPKERPKRFTASLSALWTKAEKPATAGEALIDFDLAADTNGLTLKSYEPRIETQDDAGATVSVQLHYAEKTAKPGLVRYRLLRDTSGWKIDEISGKGWSLRGMLRLALKS